MSTGRLARDIESLLRGHWRGLLPTAKPRSPVLGSHTTAMRGDRSETGWITSGSPRTGLRVEPGLLDVGGVSPVLPLDIYASTALASWLAGPGFLIPDSDPPRYTHLVGKVTVAADLVPPIDWPDATPLAPIVDGSYASRVYTSSAALARVLAPAPPAGQLASPAGAHTGWFQLLIEACLASGRTLASRLPVGWPTAPGSAGLIWSTGAVGSRVPWAIRIDAGGMYALRLKVSALTRPILTWLEAGTLTGLGAHLGWLNVLADLVADPDHTDAVTLVSESGVSPCYSVGGPLHMIGWVWPDYTQAIMICATVAGQVYDSGLSSQGYESRVCRIAISASADATPTAVFSADALCRWCPYWAFHRQWCGTADDLYLCRGAQIWPGSAGTDAEAPVLCWWEGADLAVWKYFQASVVSTTETTGGGGLSTNAMTCADTVTERSYTGTTCAIRGGYGLSQPAEILAGTGTITDRTLSRSISGGWGGPWASSQSDNALSFWRYATQSDTSGASYCGHVMMDLQYTACSGCYPNGCIYSFRQHASVGTAIHSVKTLTSASGGQICVALSDVPGVIWYAQGGSGSRLQWQQTTTHKSVSYDIRQDWVDYYSWAYHRGDPSLWVTKCEQVKYARVPYRWGPGTGADDPFGVVAYGASVSTQSSNRISYSEGAGTLRLRGRTLPAGSWADWQYLGGDGREETQTTVYARVSARGSGMWVPYGGSVWASDGGVSPTVCPDADSWAGI